MRLRFIFRPLKCKDNTVDLSKAFDSFCHPLLLAKLKAYRFTDDALELMTAHLLGRRQRVKLDGVFLRGKLLGPGYHRDPC